MWKQYISFCKHYQFNAPYEVYPINIHVTSGGVNGPDEYSEPCQTSKIKCFAKMVKF